MTGLGTPYCGIWGFCVMGLDCCGGRCALVGSSGESGWLESSPFSKPPEDGSGALRQACKEEVSYCLVRGSARADKFLI